jgi:tetratricopeptide (TPR) repeat protein
MLQEFRQYLLIRKRIDEYNKVNQYIVDFRFAYQRSLLVGEQMHQATRDILLPNNKSSVEDQKWERWLKEQFEDETLDGLNRYAAFVRLTFYYLKYNYLEELTSIYTMVHRLFENGQYYSKRILLNYYDYLLVLFDRKKNYEKAIFYGNLAIKGDGPDQIIYLNNLINVYIKNKEYEKALELSDKFAIKISSHKNFHAVIGFISNQIRCLTMTGKVKKATTKAKVFIDAYAKQILKYRWYRFFIAYLEALEKEEDYLQIIRLVHRYKLDKKEKEYYGKEGEGKGEIFKIYTHAKYNEGYINKKEMEDYLNAN